MTIIKSNLTTPKLSLIMLKTLLKGEEKTVHDKSKRNAEEKQKEIQEEKETIKKMTQGRDDFLLES